MTRADAIINKETLEFICSQIGVTIDFLSQKTGYTNEKIGSWMDTTNNDFPTINQAKSIAKALKVPFAGLYMSKDKLPINKLPKLRNLRTLPDEVSKDNSSLNLAVAELIHYHQFLTSSKIEMDIEIASLSLPKIPKTASKSEYSKTIREFFDLRLDEQFKLSSPRKFYLYVRQKIESKGIFVHCFTGVDVEIARGISIYSDVTPIIGINHNDRPPAKTFSIIHELVHILKRQSTLCNEMVSSFSNLSEEVFCNAVAGETLVPVDSLNAYMNRKDIETINLNEIATIAKRFNVSKEVITRRLYDTKWIPKDVYDMFMKEIEQKREMEKNARKEGRSQPIFKNVVREAVDKTSPSICKILLNGYSDGYFSKQDISGYLGIKEKHIQKFFDEVTKW